MHTLMKYEPHAEAAFMYEILTFLHRHAMVHNTTWYIWHIIVHNTREKRDILYLCMQTIKTYVHNKYKLLDFVSIIYDITNVIHRNVLSTSRMNVVCPNCAGASEAKTSR